MSIKTNTGYQLAYLVSTKEGLYLSKDPITGSKAVFVTIDSIAACKGGYKCERRTPSVNLRDVNGSFGKQGTHSKLHSHVKICIKRKGIKFDLISVLLDTLS